MTRTKPRSLWFPTAERRSNAAVRLLCLPYAGGTPAVFDAWSRQLDPSIEVMPALLPGRSLRFAEAPFTSTDALVKELTSAVMELEPKLPLALFGHCTGALALYELAHSLRGGPHAPIHLFVSCCRAPHLPDRDAPIHHLPDDELCSAVARMGGTSAEILEQPELMELLLPMLRADFELSEGYCYRERGPLPCPITVFGGQADDLVSLPDLTGWREQTQGAFALHMLPGSHYLLDTSQREVLELIGRQLGAAAEPVAQVAAP